MDTLKTRLSKYISEYLNTTVIFLMDVFLSASASGILILLLSLFDDSGAFTGSMELTWLGMSVAGSALMFYVCKSYRMIIRHSTMRNLATFVVALAGKEVLTGAVIALAFGFSSSHAVLLLADFLISLFFLLIVRVLMVLVYERFMKNSAKRQSCLNVLVYGTSDKSVATITRLSNSPHYKVVGFLTDGEGNIILSDYQVFRYCDEKTFSRIIVSNGISAVLFASEKDAQEKQSTLIQYALRNRVKVLVAPTIDEMVGGRVAHNRVREIKIEDLLERQEIKISLDEIKASLKDKVVMVTGAAGSIGSELCRQLAGFGVRRLLLYDNAETPMHELRLELEERFPELNFVPVIGDVRLSQRLDFAFRSYRPQVVFHAAAYKHVPLMEENPCEAVLVNVVGSRNVADKCIEYGIDKMVMISTDKAVNPTNIMGCTKRLAEIYVQSLGMAVEAGRAEGRTKFVTTRFGNVLGSNGSVIPRFREQIENGGPVTVTDKNITRFFMTIPEACRLVMEAVMLPTANKICVFDMGRSVKIDHLARRMIELAGFEPDKDIKVEYTGLRPGEKLYEEVLSNAENTIPTTHERIRIAKVRAYDYEVARDYVARLEHLSRMVDIPDMVRLMKEIVPEYVSNNSEFEKYDRK